MKRLALITSALFLLILGACSTATPKKEEATYPYITNPGKIKAIRFFEHNRAIAITQEESEDKTSRIMVGQKYAYGLYTKLKKDPDDYAKEKIKKLGSDEHMYIEVYDLASKSLKPRKIDLLQAVSDYDPDALPSVVFDDVVLAGDKEYINMSLVKYDAADRSKTATEYAYLDPQAGKLISREEVKQVINRTPSIYLKIHTNFTDKMNAYNFYFGTNDNQIYFDDRSQKQNTRINLIKDNPKLKKMIYEEGGSVYLLLGKSTDEEWVDTLLRWFSTDDKPLEVSSHTGPTKGPKVSSYAELMAFLNELKVYDTTSSSSSAQE